MGPGVVAHRAPVVAKVGHTDLAGNRMDSVF